MKKLFIILIVTAFLVSCSKQPAVPASASVAEASSEQAVSTTSDEASSFPQVEYPLLVTSFGQNADGILVREMLSDLKADFTYETVVAAEEMSGYKTVMLVVGASAKSLSSIGVTEEAELKRCEALLSAVSADSKVFVVRIGDMASQDSLTAKLLDLSLSRADMAIVTQNSDRDGKISELAAENGMVYSVSASVRDIVKILGILFS